MCVWRSAKFKSIPLWIKSVLSRGGSIASDHHCSPERRIAQVPLQSSPQSGEWGARARLCSCALLTVHHRPACRSLTPALVFFDESQVGCGQGGRWRCLVPSVTLVNGGPAWQFTMRLSVTSVVSDSATPWTGAHQAPLSMGFPRQEYWSGLPCPSPGDLPDPGIEPVSLMTLALADMLLTTSATWQAQPWGWCGANIGGEKGMSLD